MRSNDMPDTDDPFPVTLLMETWENAPQKWEQQLHYKLLEKFGSKIDREDRASLISQAFTNVFGGISTGQLSVDFSDWGDRKEVPAYLVVSCLRLGWRHITQIYNRFSLLAFDPPEDPPEQPKVSDKHVEEFLDWVEKTGRKVGIDLALAMAKIAEGKAKNLNAACKLVGSNYQRAYREVRRPHHQRIASAILCGVGSHNQNSDRN